MEPLDIYKSIQSISEKIYYTYIALAQEEIKNGINSIRYIELLKSVNILNSRFKKANIHFSNNIPANWWNIISHV